VARALWVGWKEKEWGMVLIRGTRKVRIEVHGARGLQGGTGEEPLLSCEWELGGGIGVFGVREKESVGRRTKKP